MRHGHDACRGTAWSTALRPGPHRHLRLALPALARRVLSAGPGAAARARVRLADAADDRDQRLVLFAAAAGVLRRVARRRRPTTSSSRSRARATSRTCCKLNDVETPLANFFASGVFRLKRQARADPLAVPAAARLRPGRASTPSSRCCRATPAPPWRWRARHDGRVAGRAALEIDAVRPLRHAVEVRHRELRRSGLRRAAAAPPDRPRRRRHRGPLAAARGPDRRLRLRAPARRRGALRQRLQRRRARPLGRAHRRLAARRPGRGRPPGFAAAGTAAQPRATCTATSTTTSRSTRRTTPPAWPRASACRPACSPASASSRRPGCRRRGRARLRFGRRARQRRHGGDAG